MPASFPCPVQEIEGALSEYIHTRQETLGIRRVISNYLYAKTRPSLPAVPDQHLETECPRFPSSIKHNPPSYSELSGARINYLRALQASSHAEARLSELHATLNQLRCSHSLHISVHSGSDDNNKKNENDNDNYNNDAVRSYADLLRIRNRHSALHIAQDSLNDLISADLPHGQLDFSGHVKDNVGERPAAPANVLGRWDTQPSLNHTAIFQLKKAVLDARVHWNQANAHKMSSCNLPQSAASPWQHVYALGCAKDVMIVWIEVELAKLNEASELLEDTSPLKSIPSHHTKSSTPPSETRIREAYDRYAASRSLAISLHASLQCRPPYGPSDIQPKTRFESDTQGRVAPRTSQPYNYVVDHLPFLLQTLGSQRALLQQAVYLDTKLTAAELETLDSLSRLLEESHLLSWMTERHGAWGKIAEQTQSLDKLFIHQRLQESLHLVGEVDGGLGLLSLQGQLLVRT